MGGDMVVALSSATTTRTTFFGHNRHGPTRAAIALHRAPGRAYALGETVRTQFVELPQARQTCTVLGCQSAESWGYHAGVNEHQVAIGQSRWQSQPAHDTRGLSGDDLVRLALERSRTARQALETITDLVTRHREGTFSFSAPAWSGVSKIEPEEKQNVPFSGSFAGSVFLIADPREAYLLEAAGSFWAWLEVREPRAASDVSLIRQDWQRLVPGLAEHAFQHGWWPDDGSKLDFGCVNHAPLGQASALRRWGRASLLLEEQHGHIDAPFLRRLLSDHYEGTTFEVDPLDPADGPRSICRHSAPNDDSATVLSFLTELAPDGIPMAWCAFGPPCLSVYLPIFLDGEIPEAYQRLDPALVPWHPGAWAQRQTTPHRFTLWREAVGQLQTRIDQETEEFIAQAKSLKGDRAALHRQTTLFMQNHLEQLESTFFRLDTAGRRPVFSTVE